MKGLMADLNVLREMLIGTYREWKLKRNLSKYVFYLEQNGKYITLEHNTTDAVGNSRAIILRKANLVEDNE